jgi:hypothetical protein
MRLADVHLLCGPSVVVELKAVERRRGAMTTPYERTRALVHTRQFLQDLCDSERSPAVPDPVRVEARRLLRHYPSNRDLELLVMALPQWFAREDGRDRPSLLELLGESGPTDGEFAEELERVVRERR